MGGGGGGGARCWQGGHIAQVFRVLGFVGFLKPKFKMSQRGHSRHGVIWSSGSPMAIEVTWKSLEVT